MCAIPPATASRPAPLKLNIRDVTVRMGRYGLGGAVAAGASTANGICYLSNCEFFGCVTGIGDLVDAHG